MSSYKYTEEQVEFIIEERSSGKTFPEIEKLFNKRFKSDTTSYILKKTYYRHRDSDSEDSDALLALKSARRATKSKGQVLKENQVLLDNAISKEEFLTLFNDALKLNPPKIHKTVDAATSHRCSQQQRHNQIPSL